MKTKDNTLVAFIGGFFTTLFFYIGVSMESKARTAILFLIAVYIATMSYHLYFHGDEK